MNLLIGCNVDKGPWDLNFPISEGAEITQQDSEEIHILYRGEGYIGFITVLQGNAAKEKLNALHDFQKKDQSNEASKNKYFTESVKVLGEYYELKRVNLNLDEPDKYLYGGYVYLPRHDVLLFSPGATSSEAFDYFKDWLSTISEK